MEVYSTPKSPREILNPVDNVLLIPKSKGRKPFITPRNILEVMSKELLSVIIPGYNEEAIVASTIEKVHKVMSSLHRPFEIFIVDDGSRDATPKIVQKLIDEGTYPELRFKRYDNGPSRRENLAKSFQYLKGEYVLLLDMDLAMDIKHLSEMVHWLELGYDMVIANRYHKQSHIKRRIDRFFVSKGYNAVIRLLFWTGIKDNICGFKAFKRDIILRLVMEAGIDSTRMRSVFWDTEILIRALRHGYRIKELPVTWIEGKCSALRFNREVTMIPYITKFWFSGLFRKK